MEKRFESARRPSAGLAHLAFDYWEACSPPNDIFTAGLPLHSAAFFLGAHLKKLTG
jgi:hypothetical protein